MIKDTLRELGKKILKIEDINNIPIKHTKFPIEDNNYPNNPTIDSNNTPINEGIPVNISNKVKYNKYYELEDSKFIHIEIEIDVISNITVFNNKYTVNFLVNEPEIRIVNENVRLIP